MEKCSSPSSSSAAAGLKFGKKIYFETGRPSPAKKGRCAAAEPPRCQVEGCEVDLSDAKTYYSRHKVCAMHSKSPKVTVAGIEQRFCQQCSRFHRLPEFDQGKRSCRRRLAGHNERRRKPSTGSLLSPRHGSIPPSMFDNCSQTGGFVMDLISSCTTFTGRNPWPNAALETQAAIAGKPQLTWLSSPQIPLSSHLLQGTWTQPKYSRPGVPSEGCYNGVSDASSALSLLSNHPWSSKPHAPGFEANNFLVTSGATSIQPSIHHPDLGLGQVSHPASGSQYPGELGLAQPGDEQVHRADQSRGYRSCVDRIQWSR